MPEYLLPIQIALVDMWASIVSFLPQFIFALVLLLAGILLAHVLYEAVVRLVAVLKLDEALQKLEVHDLVKQSGVEFHAGRFFGWLVKWFVIILTLIVVADTLNWSQVTVFLSQVVLYLPNVLISVVILLVGILLGRFVQDVITGAFAAAKMKTAGFLGGLAKWAIYAFSFMAALVQLGIAESLIMTLFTGFVAMIALAGGLAFGLGGRDHASRVLDSIVSDLKEKN